MIVGTVKYLAFPRHIDKNVPADLDVHLVVDNYATHKHVKVKAWLARRPCYHVHYTPTYASWINQVESWFGIITQQAIRRRSFSSVPQLRKGITEFVDNYNSNRRPSRGPQPRIPFSTTSNALVYLFPGPHTSGWSRNVSPGPP